MPVPLLDLEAQNGPLRGEILAAIARVVDSQRFIGGPEVESLERDLAAHLGVGHAVGLSSGTDALLVALMALGIGPGDEVITPTFSFFATAGSVSRLGATPIFVDVDPVTFNMTPEAFERAITPRTRLLQIAHQINLTGQITPVKAVCQMARRRGLETIVDGAHSFAQFYFKQSDLDCDYFATSLHKWLYSPKGTGLLFIKRDKIAKVWPLFAAEEKQKADIRKFEEIGTHSAAIKLAIGEALLFHNSIGGKRKEARLRYLSRYWMNRLKDVPKIRFNTSFDPNQSCAIANVQIEGTNPEAVAKYLFDKHHIFVTPIIHEEFQGLRITPNIYTTLGELDRFCEQMELIARDGLPS